MKKQLLCFIITGAILSLSVGSAYGLKLGKAITGGVTDNELAAFKDKVKNAQDAIKKIEKDSSVQLTDKHPAELIYNELKPLWDDVKNMTAQPSGNSCSMSFWKSEIWKQTIEKIDSVLEELIDPDWNSIRSLTAREYLHGAFDLQKQNCMPLIEKALKTCRAGYLINRNHGNQVAVVKVFCDMLFSF
jgi:hypothetical protein